MAVLSAPALSGDGMYEGAASTYLAHARPGSKVAVTVRPSNVAFHPPKSLRTPIWADRKDVRRLIKDGDTFFVCGDGRRMAPAVVDTRARIYAEASGATPEEAEAWMTEMQQQHARYVADVFA